METMKTQMESPLLKAVRELDESMARFQSIVSLPPPMRELLEVNRKQKEILAGFEAFHAWQTAWILCQRERSKTVECVCA